jgi:tetratricopeptide (TPR) repeat protein
MGGEREKAASYLEHSAERALSLRAYAEAARAFGDFAAQLETLGRGREAALAHERQGVTLTTAAQYDEALVALESAAAFYEAHRFDHAHAYVNDYADNRARVLAEIGEVHAQRATSDEGIARLEAVLRTFGNHDPSSRSLAALYLSLAWLVNTTGRFSDALPLTERAAHLASEAGDVATLVKANLRRGHLLLMLQRMEEGISLFRRALPVLEENQDYRSLRFALNNLGWIHEARGDFETDRQYTERARGLLWWKRGDWDRASDDLAAALTLARRMRHPYDEAKTLYRLGQVELSAGRVSQARKRLTAAKCIFVRLGERLYHEHVVETLSPLNDGIPSALATRCE